MDKKRCAIVIPVYKKREDCDLNERASTVNTVQVMQNYDIYFIGPKTVAEDYQDLGIFIPLEFESISYAQYNAICKSPGFYQIFLDLGYKYMCLVQQDVWIFNDNLEYFLDKFDEKGYDMIGSYWYGVGFTQDGTGCNGGFCIRRLSIFKNICRKYPGEGGNEDVFFCIRHKEDLKLAPERLALEFSFEEKPHFQFYLNKERLPMGCHAYASTSDRLQFWKGRISPLYEIKAVAGNVPSFYFNPKHTVKDE